MPHQKTTIEPAEVAKFRELAESWWDPNGSLKTLHDINPTRLEFIQKFTALHDKTILDLGCGGGILSESMVALGAHVTGLDVDATVQDVAKRHAMQQGLTIDYVCQPIETYLLAQTDVFDVVTCMEMLEHVPEPALVVQHAARLLKPGGLLFLSTLNRTLKAYVGAIVIAEYVLNALPRQTHDFMKLIKPSELASMIREAGCEVVSIEGMGYNPLKRVAYLQQDVDVNYLVVCRKLSP